MSDPPEEAVAPASSGAIAGLPAEAAARCARRHGLEVSGVHPIGGYANTMVRLEPWPLVARVSTGTALVRDGAASSARELAFARCLASAGVPAVRPSDLLPPGPHREGGFVVSFWTRVEIVDPTPGPSEVGAALRQLHATLPACDAPLDPMSTVAEAARMTDHPRVSRALGPLGPDLLRPAFARVIGAIEARRPALRPLHGDAHHGNLWRTRGGLLWGDFEDCCLGPVEWDVACATATSVVLGTGRAAAATLDAYGDADRDLLDPMTEARTLQGVVWAALLLDRPGDSPRLARRLDWLRERSREAA